MIYSPSTRTAFLHLHKTGGVSLRAVLQFHLPDMQPLPGLPEAHYSLATVFEVLGAEGIDPYELTFVTAICHPMSHAVSIYEWWRSDRIPESEVTLPHVALTRRLDFPSFLREVLVQDQFKENLVVDDAVPSNVTLLHRETLRSDTRTFLTNLLGREVKITMPVRNSVKHASPDLYFDEELKQELAKIYRWTFDQGWYDADTLPPDEGRSGKASRLLFGLKQRLHGQPDSAPLS